MVVRLFFGRPLGAAPRFGHYDVSCSIGEISTYNHIIEVSRVYWGRCPLFSLRHNIPKFFSLENAVLVWLELEGFCGKKEGERNILFHLRPMLTF